MSMTLLSLKPSPYSRRVVWSLDLLGLNYEKEEYVSIAGEPALRWRLGRWKPWQRVTVPVAFITTERGDGNKKVELVLENGVEIVEWANEQQATVAKSSTTSKRVITSLIPSAHRSEVLRYCQVADDFQNFDRGMFLRALRKHPPSVLRAVVGDGPPNFILHIIGFIVGLFMTTKYNSTLQASMEEIEQKAKALEETIIARQTANPTSSLVFVVGNDITMADIFLSVAICGGVKDRSKPKTDHQKTMDQAVFSQGFSMEKKYPKLYDWAVRISETYKVD